MRAKHGLLVPLFTCVLAFFCAISAGAVELTDYYLEELGLSISLPLEQAVLTRETDAEDPNLSAYGLDKESLDAYMESNYIYLNSMDENMNYEIVVTMRELAIDDFNAMSDTVLSTIASSLEAEYKGQGITTRKSELYRQAQTKFILISFERLEGDATVHGIQYYTVCAGKAISVTLYNYQGEPAEDDVALLKQVIDSMVFDVPPKVEELVPTDSFLFTDSKTSVTFTVPANWIQEDISTEVERLDAKFVSAKDKAALIMYTSSDIWSELPSAEKTGQTRADINNNMFTKEDVAEMYGISGGDVDMVSYGQAQYYIATVQQLKTIYGQDITIAMTYAVTFNDGYMYMYQFAGASDSPLYGDFTALLTSVKYHGETAALTLPSAAPQAGGEPELEAMIGRYTFVNLLFSLAMTIVIYSLPIAVYRFWIRQAPVEAKKAKKIAIIYGVCAFTLMALLVLALGGDRMSTGAILLWSYVNYRILIGGKTVSESDQATTGG